MRQDGKEHGNSHVSLQNKFFFDGMLRVWFAIASRKCYLFIFPKQSKLMTRPLYFPTPSKYLHLPVLQRKNNGNNAWFALKSLHQVGRLRTIFLQLAIKGDCMSSSHWTFTTTKNLTIHRSSKNSKNSVWNTLALNNWGAISARYIFSRFLVKRQTAWHIVR